MPYTGQGSGLYGSLKSGDLSDMPPASAKAGAPPAPQPGATYVDLPLSGMRETIAKRLSSAKQSIPHYQLCATVNVDKTLQMREKVNQMIAKTGQKVRHFNMLQKCNYNFYKFNCTQTVVCDICRN